MAKLYAFTFKGTKKIPLTDLASVPVGTKVIFRVEPGESNRFGYEIYVDGKFVTEDINWGPFKSGHYTMPMPDRAVDIEFRVYKLKPTKHHPSEDDFIREDNPEILQVTLSPEKNQQQGQSRTF